ncbi:hypothetical protein QGN23_14105 [Chryseobacterium gotjawalense]|uniref:Uncharacterized protein n=1 Tax=Chryseobacterium gotjawalense TaxID=3042315 RepID=A0ABY8RDF1_9FLAO|nr:hypothetical protein [Chryseobacterium sp. wdc7]WHF51539.1 hypothetical protein QGN23_14105 [Chryseobacterium sp. wdc7]
MRKIGDEIFVAPEILDKKNLLVFRQKVFESNVEFVKIFENLKIQTLRS